MCEGNMNGVLGSRVLNGGVQQWDKLRAFSVVSFILSCHWRKPSDALILISLICHLDTRRWCRQRTVSCS